MRSLFKTIIGLICVLVAITVVEARGADFTADQIDTLLATADASFESTAPSVNDNTTTLWVGNWSGTYYRAIIRFDKTEIRTDRPLLFAWLILTKAAAGISLLPSDNFIGAWFVDQTWVEGEVTGEIRATAVPWNKVGPDSTLPNIYQGGQVYAYTDSAAVLPSDIDRPAMPVGFAAAYRDTLRALDRIRWNVEPEIIRFQQGQRTELLGFLIFPFIESAVPTYYGLAARDYAGVDQRPILVLGYGPVPAAAASELPVAFGKGGLGIVTPRVP